MKKTGFGAGKVVGLGGHVEPGETPAGAAVREVQEESGIIIDPDHLQLWAELTFRFPAKPHWDQVVSVFRADQFSGKPSESEELTPDWTPVKDLPLAQMWDDARYWLPQVLSGQRVRAEITFADDCQTVAQADVTSLDLVAESTAIAIALQTLRERNADRLAAKGITTYDEAVDHFTKT